MNLYCNLLTTCLLLEIIIFTFCLYLINSLIDKKKSLGISSIISIGKIPRSGFSGSKDIFANF